MAAVAPVRRLRPVLLGLMLGGVCVLAAGCAGPRGASGVLTSLRGRSVLVVAEGMGDEAASQEEVLERRLALLPLRTWPGSADGSLRELLASGPADDAEAIPADPGAPGVAEENSSRVFRAREAAEGRRLPWLLISSAKGLRVETARSGRVLWTSRDGARPAAVTALGLALRPSGPGHRQTLLDRESTRLASAEELSGLRNRLLSGDFEAHKTQTSALIAAFPADPSLRTHAAIPKLLAGDPDSSGLPVALAQARDLNPEGESELLALALAAEGAGKAAVEYRLRTWLVRLYPERLDYLPEWLDSVALHLGSDRALSAALVALQAAQDRRPLLPREGSRPAEEPLALPYADLVYATAWYQGLSAAWKYAANNYDDAALRYERMDRPREQADALNNIGVALVQMKRPMRALGPLREAIRIRAEEGILSLATSRYNYGKALWDLGRVEAAWEALERSAEDSAAAGRATEALDTRIEGLELLVLRGDRAALESRAQELVDVSSVLPDTPDGRRHYEASVLFELGRSRLRFEDGAGAVAAYDRAQELWDALGRRLEVGQCLYSKATPLVAMERFDRAFAILLDALSIAVELGDTESILIIRDQLPEIESLALTLGQALPEVPDALLPWVGGAM